MYRTADISGLSCSLVQRYISAVRYTNVNGIVLFFISVVPVVVGELYYYYVYYVYYYYVYYVYYYYVYYVYYYYVYYVYYYYVYYVYYYYVYYVYLL